MYDEPDYSYEPDPPEPPIRAHSATGFPEIPIKPKDLFDKVSKQLQSFKLVVPDKSQKMVEDLCKGFNECIRLNSDSKEKKHPQTLVFSPKTGSAKSVTAKMYIAMLKNEHSLVVVPTVNDANTFCKDINEWSGNANYARCTYSINDDNPKSSYHIEKRDVEQYRCIVITHNMYIEINKYPSRKLSEILIAKDSKLVIIDERISLYNRDTLTCDQVSELIDIFTKIDMKTNYNLKDDIASLEVILELFKELKKQTTEAKKSELILPLKKQQKMQIKSVKFHSIGEVLRYDSIIDVTKFVSEISGISSVKTNKNLKNSISELREIVEKIGIEDFSFHTKGEYNTILFTSNIEPLFGSSVVLDATASINEIYEIKTYYKASTIKHIVTVDPRIYNNFTIHKAKGYPQGRSTLYNNQKATEYKEILSNYAQLATGLLTDPADKLLIVTFKILIPTFEKLLKGNKKISITNWGNHVGKNEWSDCNKVMIIGWFRMPDTEYHGNYINSMNSLQVADYMLKNDTIERFKKTQLIDDLVQATMRCSARKIVSNDGDCAKSEAYLFFADNTEGHEVIRRYTNEFKGAKVVDWNPVPLLASQKLSKATSNIDLILDYLEKTITDKNTTVARKAIIDYTGLSKSIIGRTLKEAKFIEQLSLRGFEEKSINKQSKVFCLK